MAGIRGARAGGGPHRGRRPGLQVGVGHGVESTPGAHEVELIENPSMAVAIFMIF